MFARFGHWLLIVALLGATGTHWAVLQSVAWANMLASNARTESLQAAIADTFDGRHACSLCKQIARNRQSEKKPDLQVEFKKLEFPPQAIVFVFNSPTDFRVVSDFYARGSLLTQTPPVPPPRSSLV